MNPRFPTPPGGGDPAPDTAAHDALLAGHALGDLDPAECEQLEALLQGNPALQQRLDEFHTTLELLPLALPPTAAPPPRLRRRLLQRREAAAPSPAGGPGLSGGWFRGGAIRSHGLRIGWIVPAVLGLAVLALGFELQQTRLQVAQLQQRVQAAATPASPQGRRLLLRGMTPDLRASGEVMVTGNPTHNVLMLNDLPPAPPHHVYRLWATVDGQRVGCVAFVPTAQGHVAMLIPPMPTSLATSVSVTLETDPVGTEPRGTMVLSSAI